MLHIELQCHESFECCICCVVDMPTVRGGVYAYSTTYLEVSSCLVVLYWDSCYISSLTRAWHNLH